MSELAERAHGVASKLADSMLVDDLYADEAAHIIEQALLAERRLARIDAFEESAKIARRYQTAVAPTTNAAERIEYLILERAAAEKEE